LKRFLKKYLLFVIRLWVFSVVDLTFVYFTYTYIFNIKGEDLQLTALFSVYVHILVSPPDDDPNLGSKIQACRKVKVKGLKNVQHLYFTKAIL